MMTAADKNWNVNLAPPFRNEWSARFVCVDAEAYERNNSIVTEIGIAILDTDDIIGVAPGEKGQNWFPLIETHHLRVKEVSDMVNHEFVNGCPDYFDFGLVTRIQARCSMKLIAFQRKRVRLAEAPRPACRQHHREWQRHKPCYYGWT